MKIILDNMWWKFTVVDRHPTDWHPRKYIMIEDKLNQMIIYIRKSEFDEMVKEYIKQNPID